MYKNKVFRDPIYNLISIDPQEEKVLLDLIDLPVFQRLKQIKQLGLTCYTYPSATHTRFAHCIGVSYLSGIIFDNLPLKSNEVFNIKVPGKGTFSLKKSELRLLVKIAGLLHDIGHGPFSHLFEQISNIHHENVSIQLIKDEKSPIYKTILSISDSVVSAKNIKQFPAWVGEILDKTFPIVWVRELISSQLDADRIDYLMRDAYMCGVKYSNFDLEWFLHNLNLKPIKNGEDEDGSNYYHLVVNFQKGAYSIEAYIMARYHMYKQVYFHKTTRGFEKLLIAILNRAKELQKMNKSISFIDSSLPKVLSTSEKRNINNLLPTDVLQAFQLIDDNYMMTQIRLWSEYAQDDVLKELATCFINRKPYKLIEKERDSEQLTEKQFDAITAYFKKAKFKKKHVASERENNKDYFYLSDTISDNPYKDEYLLGKKDPNYAELIWLWDKNGQTELSQVSPYAGAIENNPIKIYRYYIHKDYYKEVQKILNKQK